MVGLSWFHETNWKFHHLELGREQKSETSIVHNVIKSVAPGTRSDLAGFRRYFLFSSGRLLSTFSFFWNIFRKTSVRRVSSVFLFFLLEDTCLFLFFNLDAWMIQPRLDSSRNHCERASGRATERRYS